jgi:hypothetical protein
MRDFVNKKVAVVSQDRTALDKVIVGVRPWVLLKISLGLGLRRRHHE